MRKFTDDEMAQIRKHGRVIPRGEKVWNSKLTAALVTEIRKAYGPVRGCMKLYHPPNGVTMTELARRYGLCHTHISQIIHRKIWRHVP